ncbi:tannase/feruloyl esterase family alpha/beta hydrolase [Planctomycetota bacterium]
MADGIICNYIAARQLFDVKDGIGKTDPWANLRAPGGIDPNPNDTSASAKLTDGQIETLELVYSRYKFATPLANGVETFGMWVPNTDPSGSGLIESTRFRGQEGAAENAPMHSHLGVIGATGFLMQDLSANPLDYVEGGELNERREELSQWLDSTNPDLSAFYQRGGKLIVTIGTNDTLASPGAQLDYYQSVIDKMGQDTVDAFARFFVLPQTGHGLSGRSYEVNGDGQTIPVTSIPNQFDKTSLIMAWVEQNQAPAKTLVVTSGQRSLPLCSYPNYPKYVGGPTESASSYVSTEDNLDEVLNSPDTYSQNIEPNTTIAKHIIFTGRVQGVGFRNRTRSIVNRYQLTGFVKNLEDGTVEFLAQGLSEDIDNCIQDIKEAFADNIKETKIDEIPFEPKYSDFQITY